MSFWNSLLFDEYNIFQKNELGDFFITTRNLDIFLFSSKVNLNFVKF